MLTVVRPVSVRVGTPLPVLLGPDGAREGLVQLGGGAGHHAEVGACFTGSHSAAHLQASDGQAMASRQASLPQWWPEVPCSGQPRPGGTEQLGRYRRTPFDICPSPHL